VNTPWSTFAPDELCRDPTVLAVDPGGTTGWSVLSVHPDCLTAPDIPILANITHWSHGQVDCKYENAGVDALCELIEGWPGACVLIEQFVIRRFDQQSDFLSPVRITAALDYAVRRLGVWTTYRQQPSEAMQGATDARLRSWGLYQREGGMQHARDADRHAIMWLRKAKDPKLGERRRHEWWPHLY
jgi:hypothetical protein